MGVKYTDKPILRNIKMWVTRCSRTPKNCGFSPGAEHSDSFFSELTWLILSTVAATNLEREKGNINQIKFRREGMIFIGILEERIFYKNTSSLQGIEDLSFYGHNLGLTNFP